MQRILKNISNESIPYLFLLPCLLILGSLLSVPLYKVVEYSLYDNVIVQKNPSFVGLQNYQEILGDIAFWKATLNTIIFTVGSVIGHLIIGTGLALLVNTDINPKARTLFRSLLILPWIFTAVVVGIVFARVSAYFHSVLLEGDSAARRSRADGGKETNPARALGQN